jgi:hypothetical protein
LGHFKEVRVKRMLWGLVLVFVTSAFAQQQQQPIGPPYTTPPTFPQDKAPRQQMPPDTKAPPPSDSLSTAQVQRQIQEKLIAEPALANTNVEVKTTDKSVTLTGSVDRERQHDLALRIAQSYAGDRKIVDKIKIRGQA